MKTYVNAKVTVSAYLVIDNGWEPSGLDAAIAIYEAGEEIEVKVEKLEE